MPPKPKLHKNSGKASINKPTLQPNTSEPSTSNGTVSPELEQQFEVELCWCIQQLQSALKSGKLNRKQVQDHTKALNTLMSNTAPMVKKRQVMRLSFGDYRSKMAAQDKTSSRNFTKIKLTSALPNKNSIFVKKSLFATSSGNAFRFNFADPKDTGISEDLSHVKLDSEESVILAPESNGTFNFKPTDNGFRFNFDVNTDT